MNEYRKDFREFQREAYWSFPRVFMMGALGIAGLCSIAFGVNYFAYGSFSFFAPKYEAVRRDVMIESRAYQEGTIRRIYELRLQYEQAQDDSARATIRQIVLHETRAFDRRRLPRDLQAFINQMGG